MLRKIRDRLEERRIRLVGELAQGKLDESELDRVDSQAEMVDVAQSLEHQSRSSSLKEQELRELQAVDRALRKLSIRQYGVCEDCEEEIPDKRLLAVPETSFCARCQTVRERESSRIRIA